jgi:hypothetical protein
LTQRERGRTGEGGRGRVGEGREESGGGGERERGREGEVGRGRVGEGETGERENLNLKSKI